MIKKWEVTLENQETGKTMSRKVETHGERSGFAEVIDAVKAKMKAKKKKKKDESATPERWRITDMKVVEMK